MSYPHDRYPDRYPDDRYLGGTGEGYFEGLADGRERTEEEWAAFYLRHDTYWT